MNKLVARYNDGYLLKGTTTDFGVAKETIHVSEYLPEPGEDRVEVQLTDLKALFFVKDFGGNPDHVDRKTFQSAPAPSERWVEVTFNDGEVLVGTTPRYRASGPGFFVIPADPDSNNERCFVIESSTKSVRYI